MVLVSCFSQVSYFMSFFSRLVMKSLAVSEISSKASSSKSQEAEVTLDRVSLSSSPMKGDKPLSLRGNYATLAERRESWRMNRQTHISSTMTMSDFPSKASMHCTSLGWWRLFMMPISCRTFSLSFALYTLMNLPAHTFFVAFSSSLKTCPNFPLSRKQGGALRKH
ncbi:hypothetical protein EYF80_020193 [Liparis tanakae]|uniref:Uncharacterized protein n=1 Tax=Liparis tanakae TaxID=230148 RepID=A0A4Z2HV55_9TELE|nr:hypothetical protein EYF80_020193 [Liparis tanakae]